MKKLVIFGAGQVAQLAHFYFTHDSEYEVVAFTVDRDHLTTHSFCGLPVVPFEEVEQWYPPAEFCMFIGVAYGDLNKIRAFKYQQAKEKGYFLASYISSKAATWQNGQPGAPRIGDNCFILENQVIQPYCTIGNNVILWSGNHIGHHSSIGDHCFLASHIVISGNVTVEPYCFIGVNATVCHNLTVGQESIIGAGALVTRNVASHSLYKVKGTLPDERKSNQIIL